MTRRLGLFGGSFDPIHFGHLITARAVAERLNLDRVLLIPAPIPPHKRANKLTPVEHRLAMIRGAIDGDPLFEASDIETRRPGPSYTIDTIAALRADVGATAELFWIIGADSLPELATWHRAADLVASVRIVAASRPGWSAPDLSTLERAVGKPALDRLLADRCPTPEIDISATNIRERIGMGRSVRYLTTSAVIAHIQQNRLYLPNA